MLPRTPGNFVILIIVVVLVLAVASIAPPDWYAPLRHFLRELARYLS